MLRFQNPLRFSMIIRVIAHLPLLHVVLACMTIVDLKSWKSTSPRKIAKPLHNISTLPIREAIIEE